MNRPFTPTSIGYRTTWAAWSVRRHCPQTSRLAAGGAFCLPNRDTVVIHRLRRLIHAGRSAVVHDWTVGQGIAASMHPLPIPFPLCRAAT